MFDTGWRKAGPHWVRVFDAATAYLHQGTLSGECGWAVYTSGGDYVASGYARRVWQGKSAATRAAKRLLKEPRDA